MRGKGSLGTTGGEDLQRRLQVSEEKGLDTRVRGTVNRRMARAIFKQPIPYWIQTRVVTLRRGAPVWIPVIAHRMKQKLHRVRNSAKYVTCEVTGDLHIVLTALRAAAPTQLCARNSCSFGVVGMWGRRVGWPDGHVCRRRSACHRR